jgi:hypothetical protein
MEEPRTLLTFHDLTVETETVPGQELMDHMHSTVLGQQGGFRYQHMDLEDRLKAPGENYFMYLRKSGRMIGSVGFVGRHKETGGLRHDSWMIRFFSIKAPLGSAQKKRKEKSDVKGERRASVLGRFILPVFANPSQLRGELDPEAPAVIYALIEQTNLASMNFSTEMGMETVGKVTSFTFSRLWPKKSNRIERLEEGEVEEMRQRLNDYYREYTLFFTDPLFKDRNYYVIRDSGRIVAGVQIYPVRWHVVDFGSGFINRIIGPLTKIAWIRKRFDPEEMRMLAFDGIYCEPGYEKELYELMEGLLAGEGRYLAILMMDMQSELYRIFASAGRLGIIHRLLGSFSADIRFRFINIPDRVKQEFLDKPTYIPTYDNS